MNDLNYHHLRYFWAVAREGNLTRAAAQLHVSQSAVSVQIKKLEESLGKDLFDRSGRGLKLTEAGRVTLDYADSIFHIGDELVGVLDDQANLATQQLRVGVLATLSRNFQIEFLGDLLNREDVLLMVRSGAVTDMIQRLEAHQIDVVLSNFAPSRTEDANWVAHTIDEQPVSLIGQPGPARPGRLRELIAEQPLVVPTPDSGIRSGFDALVERLGVTPNIVAEVDDMAMLRLVTRAHEGLAVIPPIVVKEELEQGSLVEVEQLPGLVEPFLAITAPRSRPNALLQHLLRRHDPHRP